MKAVLGLRQPGHVVLAAIAICIVAVCASTAPAQLLYSFEDGLDEWSAATATLTNSTTLGVTDGAQSLLIDDLLSGFNNDAGHVTHGAGSGNAFNIWDAAAMAIDDGDTNVKLEFDFSWDHAGVTLPAWAQLGIFVNSTGAGFRQYGTGSLIGGNIGDTFPALADPAIADGVTLTPLGSNSVHFAIPMGPAQATDDVGLNIGGGEPGTNFYQIGFKTNGGWEGTVDWAIDNVRITGAVPPTSSETLFSWETPDNPATPTVDERFEGWLPGDFAGHTPHIHSITSTGATDGASALQIDRTNLESGFTWGSLFTLNSDTNPDPNVEEIDPTIQSRIEELIGKVEAADRVAFDVTYQYQDLFPAPDPTFTNFTLHFSDETGAFYQATGPGINVLGATSQTTATIEIPLEDFVDANNNMLTLKTTGLVDDSNFFRIGLATNTDGGQVYQIDNFRLITVLPEGVPGDYNNDGMVDAADYIVWRKNLGQSVTLPNDTTPGMVEPEDYDVWQANFGNGVGGGASLSTAVPEPATVLLALNVVACGLIARRRAV